MSPNSLRNKTTENPGTTIKRQPAKFSAMQEDLSSRRASQQKLISIFVQIFSCPNTCIFKKLSIITQSPVFHVAHQLLRF